jgi:D-alanyl-D-alanine carboxypeptidase (penicillin-binding protein 5/6)
MRYGLIALVCLVSMALFSSAQAQDGFTTAAKQAIVLDYNTGTVLLEKNADERMPTSSMSKVMTMYMVFDALKKGTITLENKFSVSEKAWRMQGSKMFVHVNDSVRVEDLIRGVIVQSGNDATIVLAEGLAGTEEAFAAAMNAKAKELGMLNSNFMNASGWPDPNHYSTARDLAILGKALITNFPDEYKYYSEIDFTFNGIKQGNRNPLLYKGIGGDGIKTGHTEDAGYGLIGSGQFDGRRVIFVVNGLESMEARSQEAAKLLDWGLKSFKNKTILKAGDVIAQADVAMGLAQKVGLTGTKDVIMTLPNMAAQESKVEITYNAPLVAPIKKGQEVAKVSVTLPGRDQPLTAPLVADSDVPELGFVLKTLEKAKILLGGV